MVLDLLTASVGGVYALLNETCCTYIPDETNGEDRHRVSDAIHQLNEIKRGMQQHVHPGRGSLFFVAYFRTVVATVFENHDPCHGCVIVVCLFTLCIVPCISTMILRMVGGTVDTMLSQDYQLLDKDQDYVILEEESLNLTIV
ncbi:hypothetical protein CHARACLAT_033406 [Characodon lateralis]|uniref:Uncharacterized protein n=1 Tax=Characodon lateralis TaxID=208331 RepID=A0ABU7E5Y0_9TELE|nr:hypothetical protein [Characodon lateralis]